jgi:hypothetical protein
MFPKTTRVEINRREFAKFAADDVVEALRFGYLTNKKYFLNLLSDDHLRALPIRQCSEQALLKIFPPTQIESENKRRFALIPADQVRLAFLGGSIPDSLFDLLSEEQLRALAN